ncbi:glutamate/aspartate ABC transporter substrate-binding protein [Neisseria leonii]|uniref:Glutamate/aspartate ABC transporter substrate-binding protein n=1 Tax=Neisseria leonii TaxID=2995413 RepID=A0A9X4IDH1_9NEIS|nr:glutamate/aspartate ABC transporter substrate-binding protein [Neisseria sp. 51.81]MDD9327207.1 glutamate/aspartate ABC transporter substrate-binding protein [Neisseria sp. 51.81]
MANQIFKPLALACMAALSLAACGGQKNEAPKEAAASAAPAEAAGSTIDKIKQSGTIVLGHRDASIPFSYIADNPNQPIGYAHDLQLKVVEALKTQLGLPDLKVRYNLVTSQNRIPLVVNGTVDLECGSTTNNLERQKQVQFSNNFFVVGTRLLADKAQGIKDYADLKGKTVVTTAGTTSERLLKEYNDKNQAGINVISAKDHGESFLMLQNGRAQAFMMDDVLLAGARAKAADPEKWEIVGTPMSYENYGCMMRKGDAEFQKIVNDTLNQVFASDEINKMYNQWFEQPIPPKNVNMAFPMSDKMKEILANPNDKAADE